MDVLFELPQGSLQAIDILTEYDVVLKKYY